MRKKEKPKHLTEGRRLTEVRAQTSESLEAKTAKTLGQRDEEEGISQRKSSRDLHKVPFESLAKYPPST